ncbi:xanthine dehydrogenase family protein molybdopterin-binding subunit [Aureimonas fodinaquatilis]|uniref:Xanthine dehydrogenase family protein molybdopterin-binding subunit n=1 Tax=Aureimonas fodinaquatilis TaxID=2565783 RepID=A0A5B0DRG7_9HYPH|nr:molybdopterin cofactor-binding domain-containing protein [Aureimonas fodinaquatilis]KAA0969068.1 xanthine dehydrogenase family protein molybdopterin-binding subunit [Aureimonas fodinaquatilis]
MANQISRRNLLKLGTFAGITVLLARAPAAGVEMNSGPSSTGWIGGDGKAQFRWDAIRKVTGQKNFARDYRARDLAGWPKQQSYAFMLKATQAARTFEGVNLAVLGEDLQPDRLLLQEDLDADGLNIPQDSDMGKGFYGVNILVPKGQTPPLLGHPVAILIYQYFARFEAARRVLQFDESAVLYGAETGPRPPANYGAGRFIRVAGQTPYDPPVFSSFQDAAIKGGFRGNTPVWPPLAPEGEVQIPPVLRKDRGGGFVTALQAADEKPDTQGRGMDAAAQIQSDIEAARVDPAKLVMERHGFSQSIDPCAMEPDNCNAWYDSASRTLHILTATQSPAGIVSGVTAMMKDNKAFPVETLVLMTGSTVGYGSKDYSVFPFYAVAAAFYGNGLAVRIANDRYEQFQMGMKRHSMEMDVTITADRQSGKFEILKGIYNCNGGGRENLSVAVSHVGARGAQSLYYFPKSDLTALAMATPAVEAGSMRGFGSLQSMALTEIMVDEIAEELDMDPMELRRRNALQPGEPNTQGGVAAGDMRLVEMLDKAAAHPIWRDRAARKTDYEAANPGRLYGVGFAQVQQVYGSSGVPTALVLEFDAEGQLTMRHCVQEIGTGATTAQQVMVWQALGKAPDVVEFGLTEFAQLPLHTSYADQKRQDELSQTDPFWTPALIPDMSSSSSVYYVGFGTRQAARFLLEHSLWPAARSIWSKGQAGGAISSFNVGFSDIRVGPDGLGGAGMRPIPFVELAREAHALGLITGVAVHAYSCWEWARAQFDIPGIGLRDLPVDALAVQYGNGAPVELKSRMTTRGYDFIKRQRATYPPTDRSRAGPTTYTPAACLVELNVNSFTGQVQIMRHHMIIDPGTMIVPELVSGQVQGGTAMGIGHALLEELPLYDDGPGNGTWNFNRYVLPRAGDVAVWAQTIDYLPPLSETSPPKGMAELGMIPIVPATANAVAHAVGKRFYEFPITPDKITRALQ